MSDIIEHFHLAAMGGKNVFRAAQGQYQKSCLRPVVITEGIMLTIDGVWVTIEQMEVTHLSFHHITVFTLSESKDTFDAKDNKTLQSCRPQTEGVKLIMAQTTADPYELTNMAVALIKLVTTEPCFVDNNGLLFHANDRKDVIDKRMVDIKRLGEIQRHHEEEFNQTDPIPCGEFKWRTFLPRCTLHDDIPMQDYKTLDLDDIRYAWTYYGEGDKYGRYAYCANTGIKRGLTMGEFYGGGTVD